VPGHHPDALLMHDHVHILSAALVTAQPTDKPPHREALAEALLKLTRAEH